MPTEEEITQRIFQALTQIQANRAFCGQKENVINDGLRDRLSMVFDCHDQTRQGVSENEIDSGSVDLLIKHNGIPVSIIESIRLGYLDQKRLEGHINKVLNNYDPNGCRIVNIVVYCMMARFSEFWTKLIEYMNSFTFPYERVGEIADFETGLAESKHCMITLRREDTEIRFLVHAVHMRE